MALFDVIEDSVIDHYLGSTPIWRHYWTTFGYAAFDAGTNSRDSIAFVLDAAEVKGWFASPVGLEVSVQR